MVVTANRLPSIQAPNQVDRTFNESNAPAGQRGAITTASDRVGRLLQHNGFAVVRSAFQIMPGLSLFDRNCPTG